MKKALALPIFLESLTLTTFLKHIVVSGALIFLLLLLWLNSDDLSTLVTPKTQSTQVACDVQHSPHRCTINTDIGPIEVSVQAEIISLEPFSVTIKTADKLLSSAKIRFEGLEDYMGINQFRFAEDSANAWQATGSIPICTTQSKTWKVIISLYNDNKYSSYWFKMKTK